MEKLYQNIVMDSTTSNKCICIEKLPTCTPKELESICLPYGEVVQIKKLLSGFALVEFKTEEIAHKAASALNASTFKGILISAYKAKPPQIHNTSVPAPIVNNTTESEYNDCEIIVLDRKNTQYAEYIEHRLKRLDMRVDLLFPNIDVPLGKVLSNISARRCLYALLVTNQHQEHNSITINVLYGVPAEHRNMPLEDAISFIGTDFRKKLGHDCPSFQTSSLSVNIGNPTVHSSISTVLPVPSTLKTRHPEHMQNLINLLADNVSLTVLQFNCIIKYLEDLREKQIKIELGTSAAAETKSKTPDPEIELQRRLLDILNKPSVAENHYPLMYETLEAVKQDAGLMNLLRDERVQRAIDSIMDSNIVSVVEESMKF